VDCRSADVQIGMQNARTVELALLTTFLALGGMALSLLLHFA
jgi:hypothetical protein